MVLEEGSKENSDWLLDAEVRYEIHHENGRWEVSLLFMDTRDPKHFFIEIIGDYHSERLARIYAEHMTKTAAKDSRGTQKVKKDAYDINDN